MRRLVTFGVALAALASGAAAQRPQANPFSAQLAKLSDLQRRAAMRRAVLDSRQYCRKVELVTHRGPYRNLDMWSVRCDRGADYGAFLGLDGSVQVRPCRDLAQLKLPPCNLPPRRR
ncbi:hypothetical protein [Sphingomonas jatrophae]|uniref:Beta/Gamma crystallin n=1 Tax=Sphingomonas jatrophae TaxID=1166337 RepID=A0A1I6L339_9SPHN|nr:hypothetical protein [Sphingomonas jatrophae]SFR97856.1 hypothetical protein SAMN05192580_2216 [Sphingomonas jatrophae]